MNIINHKSINSINSSYFMYIAWFEDITILSPAVHADDTTSPPSNDK